MRRIFLVFYILYVQRAYALYFAEISLRQQVGCIFRLRFGHLRTLRD